MDEATTRLRTTPDKSPKPQSKAKASARFPAAGPPPRQLKKVKEGFRKGEKNSSDAESTLNTDTSLGKS